MKYQIELVTENQPKRLICFKGHHNENNSVMITKVCMNYETFSKIITGEFATRTLSNLYNLQTVRGNVNETLDYNSSMSGPHDYFGFISPFNYHIIRIDNTFRPEIYRVTKKKKKKKNKNLLAIPVKNISRLNFNWIRGTNIFPDKYKLTSYDSLFDNPGILELQTKVIKMNILDAGYKYDLKEYGCKLVVNYRPFRFNQKLVNKYQHAQHKLRAITYFYGDNYVNDYLMKTNGLFLEKHEFIQSITPLHPNCGGYVILGKCSHEKGKIDLIAVEIPFGYTLLINPMAIHGDSTLRGFYLMTMTGNHDAMNTSDTVFLKNTYSYENVKIKSNKIYQSSNHESVNLLITSNIMNIYQLKFELNLLKTYILR